MKLNVELLTALADDKIVVESRSVNQGQGAFGNIAYPRYVASSYAALSREEVFQLVQLAKIGAGVALAKYDATGKTDGGGKPMSDGGQESGR